MAKEDLQKLAERWSDLSKRLYSGHHLNTLVYDERESLRTLIDDATSPRVYKIIEVVRSLPKGKWNEPDAYPSCNDDFQAIRFYSERDCKRVHFVLVHYEKGDVFFGYQYCYGEDDGYPETSMFYLPFDWICEDDETILKRKIFTAAMKKCINKVNELELHIELEREAKDQLIRRVTDAGGFV